ncbi:MAG: hypothetical protein H6719_35895 [Sandaracinaceae bacterium]|nr:hypothetical protein [Sandaracinaceae bacterium]
MTRWGSALMCLLTACSGRPIGGDAGLDAGTDAAATDAGLDASAWDASCVPLDPPADPARPWGDGPADVFEVEPNDLAPFTDCTACARGEPTGFRVGDTLGGTLSPAAVGTDWDWFVARLTGGSVVELALETDADVRLAVGTMAAATDEAPEEWHRVS